MAPKERSTGFAGRDALTVHIDTPGLQEKIAQLQKFARIGDTSARRVRWGMKKTTEAVFTEATGTTPQGRVHRGDGPRMVSTLFKKVKVWGEGNVTGNVGIGLRGATPFALEGGRAATAKRGEIVPRRFLWHAYDNIRDQVDAVWEKVLKLIVSDLAKKGGK